MHKRAIFNVTTFVKNLKCSFEYCSDRSPKYTAPEVFVLRDKVKSGPKVDVWSLGMIIVELLIGRTLWPHMKLGQCIRKVLALLHYDGSVFERLAREGDRMKIYQVITR